MLPVPRRGQREWRREERVSVLLRGTLVCFIWNHPEIKHTGALLPPSSVSLIVRRALALRLESPIVLTQNSPSPPHVPTQLWLCHLKWQQIRTRMSRALPCSCVVPGRRDWSGLSSLCPGQKDGAGFRSCFCAAADALQKEQQFLHAADVAAAWMDVCLQLAELPAVSRDGTGSELGTVPRAAAFRVVPSSPHHHGQEPLRGHLHSLEIRLWQKGVAALVTFMWYQGLSIIWPFHGLWGFSEGCIEFDSVCSPLHQSFEWTKLGREGRTK